MKVCVQGLWHLGSVTSACLASVGHQVIGLDFDEMTVGKLRSATAPVREPGLDDLIRAGLAQGRLAYTSDAQEAIAGADVLWVAYDTPVDEDDNGDVDFVVEQVRRIFPLVTPRTLVLISSQVPVGTTRTLEDAYSLARQSAGAKAIGGRFSYSPENLRLGQALAAFLQPDRLVVGCRTSADRAVLQELLHPITHRIEWMSVESAEMTKHAINAFLATSVAFINELATLCEAVGADAREVERGLRTDGRIGPRAYLTPGVAYSGGTLARDIAFLTGIGVERAIPTSLLQGVRLSNDAHKGWFRTKLRDLMGELKGCTIAIWGLTYKAGTDTLRRSSSVELCRWLIDQGARVRVHDPARPSLPEDLEERVLVASSPEEALAEASVLVVATEWPEYRSFDAASVVAALSGERIVLDPNRFLDSTFAESHGLRYVSVGDPVARQSRSEVNS